MKNLVDSPTLNRRGKIYRLGLALVELLVAVATVGFLSPAREASSAEPEIAPSIAKKVVLELPPGDDNPRNGEGSFIRLETGEILYVYTRFYGKSNGDHASARLVSRVSADNGETWSEEDALVLENEGVLNVMSVSLLRLRDRSIALFYLVKDGPDDCRPYVRFSTDEGKTWSERVATLPEKSYNCAVNDRAVRLEEGRILFPIARHAFLGGHDYNYDFKGTLYCLISDDGGRTWRESEPVPNANNIKYMEPGVVELANGDLLMTIRTTSGRQYFSRSSDRGVTWTDSEPSPLISPDSPTCVKREPGGDALIVVWNDSPDARNPLTVGILSPDGKTILTKKTLDKVSEKDICGHYGGLCYPALHFVDSDSFLVGYTIVPGDAGKIGSRVSKVRFSDLKKD